MSIVSEHVRPSRLAGGRLGRYPLLNVLLAAAATALGVFAYLQVREAPTAASTVTRTSTVTRGVVLSTVSATGNLQSARQLSVGFETGGTVSSISVKAGQHVAAGQVLGRLDDGDARTAVAQAQASLATAQAQLSQTLAGESTAQRRQDALSVTQAKAQVTTALAAAAAQKRTNAMDAQSLAAALRQAQQQLRTDQGNLRGTVAKLKADRAQLATDQAAYDTAGAAVTSDQAIVAADQASSQRIAVGLMNAQQIQASDKSNNASASKLADDQSSINSWQLEQQQASYQLSQDQAKLQADQSTQNTAQSAVNSDEANVKSDQSTIVSLEKAIVQDRTAVATARRNRASGLEKDREALATAQRQVASARQAVTSAQVANAVKQAPPEDATVMQQRAAIAQAQAALQTAKKTLSQTVLRAPAAGTVASVDGIVGQTVAGGGTSALASSSSSSSSSSSATGTGNGSSSGLVTLTDLAGMQVAAAFSETDTANLRIGQPATVTVAALGSTKLPAHIVAIDTDSTVSSGVVTYAVTFQLDRRNARLKPGMTADVEVVVGEADNALHVPSAAVTGSGAGATVTVLKNGKQTRVPVVVGLVGDSATQIAGGLAAGQTVVLPSVSISSSGTGTTGTTGTTGSNGRARFGGGGNFFPAGGLGG
ncbi:MAG: HlyD family efflux transporter periplasmic adaptor subunit [Gaiellaceae bacterium]